MENAPSVFDEEGTKDMMKTDFTSYANTTFRTTRSSSADILMMDFSSSSDTEEIEENDEEAEWNFVVEPTFNRHLSRYLGWFFSCLIGRDGFLAAALSSNPRGDALPQFWLLQRGVVVFMALCFNTCISQATREEPTTVESVLLWRVSASVFTIGSMASLISVGVFAWVGIAFSNVPRAKFPSFVSQNAQAFLVITQIHFLAFLSAVLGTVFRVLANYPFWSVGSNNNNNNNDVSFKFVGYSAILGLIIFQYGAFNLISTCSSTVCDQNGFHDQIWPGLTKDTNNTLQRHLQEQKSQQQKQQQRKQKKKKEIQQQQHGDEHANLTRPASPMNSRLHGMTPNDVVNWLEGDKRLHDNAILKETVLKESIDGDTLIELANMNSSVDVAIFFSQIFLNCPKGLAMVLWKKLKAEIDFKNGMMTCRSNITSNSNRNNLQNSSTTSFPYEGKDMSSLNNRHHYCKGGM